MKTILSLICFAMVHAQMDHNVRDPRLNEGQMFTIRFEPAGRKIVVAFAGHPELEVGPQEVKLFGRAISKSGETRTLSIRPSDSGFKIIENLNPEEKVEVEIRPTKKDRKPETHILKQP